MIDNDQYVISGQGKSDLMALAFRGRLNASYRRKGPEIHSSVVGGSWDPGQQPLPSFRGVITEEPELIRGCEIEEAIGKLALGKAPGPDGLPNGGDESRQSGSIHPESCT